MKNCPGKWVFLAGWVLCKAAAFADGPAASPVSLSVGGLIDVYYTHNATNYNDNLPGAGNAFDTSDFTDNSFMLGLAEVELSARAGDTAGLIDLGFGPTADWLASLSNAGVAQPIFNSPTDVGPIDKNILQAYVTYDKDALTASFGKFLSDFSFETLDGPQNWNYSRSFLFDYAVPNYYTGFKVGYTLNPAVSALGYVVDGWNNSQVSTYYDKDWGGELTVKPMTGLTLTFNGIYGTYLAPLSRRVGEVVGLYRVDDGLAYAFDYAIGQDDSPTPGVPGAAWSSLVLYGRWRISPGWAMAVRGEDFVDHDGSVLGIAADFREGTVTIEHPLSPQLVVKLETRCDWAVNPRDNYAPVEAFNGSTDQLTFTLGAIFAF